MNYYRFSSIIAVLFITGCSTVAPQYSSSIENIQQLKNSGSTQVAVENFEAGENKVNELSIRGGKFESPVDDSYAKYLQTAVEQELYDANRLNKEATIKVGGILLKNNIDASGFSVGTANMEAEFIVRDSSGILYRKIHSAKIEWPSSFMGNIAIPRAIKEYPRAAQILLSKLYTDPDFIKVTK
ncbi:MAG: hypothetical protein RPU64_10135 [Candidatus Sedimenticola sp. (ex Thyasira tokunagai)]